MDQRGPMKVGQRDLYNNECVCGTSGFRWAQMYSD